jgi:hypothetical protein
MQVWNLLLLVIVVGELFIVLARSPIPSVELNQQQPLGSTLKREKPKISRIIYTRSL